MNTRHTKVGVNDLRVWNVSKTGVTAKKNLVCGTGGCCIEERNDPNKKGSWAKSANVTGLIMPLTKLKIFV